MGLKPRRASTDLKTRPQAGGVEDYLDSIADERRRREGQVLLELMREVTGEEPVLWGTSIVGFGQYHYRYDSGREGDWCRAGFSPRRGALSIYCMAGLEEHGELLARLGRHRTGVSCLYVPRLDEVDLGVLREIVARSWRAMAARYPA